MLSCPKTVSVSATPLAQLDLVVLHAFAFQGSISILAVLVWLENTLTAQAPTKSRESIPDEAPNESMRILNHGTGCRRTSTSTSRKALSRDQGTAVELYACSVLQIQTLKGQGIREERMVYTHSSGCTMGGLDTDFDEPGLLVDCADSCWLSALVGFILPF